MKHHPLRRLQSTNKYILENRFVLFFCWILLSNVHQFQLNKFPFDVWVTSHLYVLQGKSVSPIFLNKKKYKMHWWTFMITSSQNNVKVDPFFGWQRKPLSLYMFVYCFLVLYSGIYYSPQLIEANLKTAFFFFLLSFSSDVLWKPVFCSLEGMCVHTWGCLGMLGGVWACLGVLGHA